MLCVTMAMVVGLQLVDQLLDLAGGDRVQRRAGLVEQQHLGLDGDAARDAQALLLAAGEAGAALSACPSPRPQRRLLQRPFDALVHLAARQVPRTGARRRRCCRRSTSGTASASGTPCPLARISVTSSRVVRMFSPSSRISPVGALLGVELEHAVEGAQQRALAAARRADEGGDLALGNVEVDALSAWNLRRRSSGRAPRSAFSAAGSSTSRP